MWTRLIAGATAHDINNLTQGLFNLLTLGSNPNASKDALARYAVLAREALQELQGLASDLRALARADVDPHPQRVDLICADVGAETEAADGRSIAAGPVVPALVQGTAAALRLAIQAPVRYGLAASPPGGVVRLGVHLEGDEVVVDVDAPDARTSLSEALLPLEELVAGPGQEFRGSLGLILAAAIARQYGGQLRLGRAPVGGLAFKIHFGRAEEVAVDARRTEGVGPRSGGG